MTDPFTSNGQLTGDRVVSGREITLKAEANNSGAITEIEWNGFQFINSRSKDRAFQTKVFIDNFGTANWAALQEAGATAELFADPSSSLYVEDSQNTRQLITKSFLGYDTPLSYSGLNLFCSGNILDKKVEMDFLGNPHIIKVSWTVQQYASTKFGSFRWGVNLSLNQDMGDVYLYNPQATVEVPPTDPELDATSAPEGPVLTADGASVSTFIGGVIAASGVTEAFGVFRGPERVGNAFTTTITRPVGVEVGDPKLTDNQCLVLDSEAAFDSVGSSAGKRHLVRYLCVGTFDDVVEAFDQLDAYVRLDVDPSDGSFIVVQSAPAAVSLGQLFDVTIAAVDEFGEVLLGYGNAVTASLLGSGSTLSGATSSSFTSGVATFTELSVADAGTYGLQFVSGDLLGSSTLVVQNPVPSTLTLNPNAVGDNAPTVQLVTVTGSDFVPGISGKLNGSPVATTYVSSTEAQIAIPPSQLFEGASSVILTNPGPGGGGSNVLTLTVTDETPPVVTNIVTTVTLVSPGVSDATVVWDTNELTTSEIVYVRAGDPSNLVEVEDLALKSTHSLTLSGLIQDTYAFFVFAEDAAGNRVTSARYTFVVGDTTPPVITPIVPSNETENGARLTWSTNEDTVCSLRYVGGGQDATIPIAGSRTSHVLQLNGLLPDTDYTATVTAVDTGGNTAQRSGPFSTTPGTTIDPPVITSGPTVQFVTDTSANITWTTDRSATSSVIYGTESGSYPLTATNAGLFQQHSVNLTGLLPSQNYFFVATGGDSETPPNVYTSPEGSFLSNPTPIGGSLLNSGDLIANLELDLPLGVSAGETYMAHVVVPLIDPADIGINWEVDGAVVQREVVSYKPDHSTITDAVNAVEIIFPVVVPSEVTTGERFVKELRAIATATPTPLVPQEFPGVTMSMTLPGAADQAADILSSANVVTLKSGPHVTERRFFNRLSDGSNETLCVHAYVTQYNPAIDPAVYVRLFITNSYVDPTSGPAYDVTGKIFFEELSVDAAAVGRPVRPRTTKYGMEHTDTSEQVLKLISVAADTSDAVNGIATNRAVAGVRQEIWPMAMQRVEHLVLGQATDDTDDKWRQGSVLDYQNIGWTREGRNHRLNARWWGPCYMRSGELPDTYLSPNPIAPGLTGADAYDVGRMAQQGYTMKEILTRNLQDNSELTMGTPALGHKTRSWPNVQEFGAWTPGYAANGASKDSVMMNIYETQPRGGHTLGWSHWVDQVQERHWYTQFHADGEPVTVADWQIANGGTTPFAVYSRSASPSRGLEPFFAGPNFKSVHTQSEYNTGTCAYDDLNKFDQYTNIPASHVSRVIRCYLGMINTCNASIYKDMLRYQAEYYLMSEDRNTLVGDGVVDKNGTVGQVLTDFTNVSKQGKGVFGEEYDWGDNKAWAHFTIALWYMHCSADVLYGTGTSARQHMQEHASALRDALDLVMPGGLSPSSQTGTTLRRVAQSLRPTIQKLNTGFKDLGATEYRYTDAQNLVGTGSAPTFRLNEGTAVRGTDEGRPGENLDWHVMEQPDVSEIDWIIELQPNGQVGCTATSKRAPQIAAGTVVSGAGTAYRLTRQAVLAQSPGADAFPADFPIYGVRGFHGLPDDSFLGTGYEAYLGGKRGGPGNPKWLRYDPPYGGPDTYASATFIGLDEQASIRLAWSHDSARFYDGISNDALPTHSIAVFNVGIQTVADGHIVNAKSPSKFVQLDGCWYPSRFANFDYVQHNIDHKIEVETEGDQGFGLAAEHTISMSSTDHLVIRNHKWRGRFPTDPGIRNRYHAVVYAHGQQETFLFENNEMQGGGFDGFQNRPDRGDGGETLPPTARIMVRNNTYDDDRDWATAQVFAIWAAWGGLYIYDNDFRNYGGAGITIRSQNPSGGGTGNLNWEPEDYGYPTNHQVPELYFDGNIIGPQISNSGTPFKGTFQWASIKDLYVYPDNQVNVDSQSSARVDREDLTDPLENLYIVDDTVPDWVATKLKTERGGLVTAELFTTAELEAALIGSDGIGDYRATVTDIRPDAATGGATGAIGIWHAEDSLRYPDGSVLEVLDTTTGDTVEGTLVIEQRDEERWDQYNIFEMSVAYMQCHMYYAMAEAILSSAAPAEADDLFVLSYEMIKAQQENQGYYSTQNDGSIGGYTPAGITTDLSGSGAAVNTAYELDPVTPNASRYRGDVADRFIWFPHVCAAYAGERLGLEPLSLTNSFLEEGIKLGFDPTVGNLFTKIERLGTYSYQGGSSASNELWYMWSPWAAEVQYFAALGTSGITNTVTVGFNLTTGVVTEGQGTTTAYQIRTLNSSVTGSDVVVNLSTSSAILQEGVDYQVPASVTLASGTSSVAVPIEILDDVIANETDATFTVTIASVVGSGQLGANTSLTLTVEDNDLPDPDPVISFSDTSLSLREGSSRTVTVLVSPPADTARVLNISTRAVAIEGVDYTLDGLGTADGFRTLTVPANAATASFTFVALTKAVPVDEGPKSVALSLEAGSSYTTGPHDAVVVTILEPLTAGEGLLVAKGVSSSDGGYTLSGSDTGSRLYNVTIPLNPPVETVPAVYMTDPSDSATAYRADVFGMNRNDQGEFLSAQVSCTLPHPTGAWSVPDDDAHGNNAIMIGYGPGIAAPTASAFPNFNFATHELEIKLANVTTPYVFVLGDTAEGALESPEVIFAGEHVRRTQYLGRFVDPGVAAVSRKAQHTALVAHVIVNERTDLDMATVDVIISNSALSGTSNPLDVDTEADGTVHFEYIKYRTNNTAQQITINAPRDTVGNVSGNSDEFWLVKPADLITGYPANEEHGMLPSHYFIRRLAVYRSPVLVETAADAARRADWAWVVGDIGYQSGGYGESGYHIPDYRQFTGAAFGGETGLRACLAFGDDLEGSSLGNLLSGTVDDGQGIVNYGWSKPSGSLDPGAPGEAYVNLNGFEIPFGGGLNAALVNLDRIAERAALAAFNLNTRKVFSDTDLVVVTTDEPDVLPYGFSLTDQVFGYHTAWMWTNSSSSSIRAEDSSNGTWALSPPKGSYPWDTNSAGKGTFYLTSNAPTINYQAVGSNGWSPFKTTHMSRIVTAMTAPLYIMNDEVAKICNSFEANARMFGQGRYKEHSRRRRTNVAYDQSNLRFLDETLNNTISSPLRKLNYGILWSTSNTTTSLDGGEGFSSPGNYTHSYANFAIYYSFADDAERQRVTDGGNTGPTSRNLPFLMGKFIGRKVTPCGIVDATAKQGASPPYYGFGAGDSDPITRTGYLPGPYVAGRPAYNNPLEYHWSVSKGLHVTYSNRTSLAMIRTFPDTPALNDGWAKHLDWADIYGEGAVNVAASGEGPLPGQAMLVGLAFAANTANEGGLPGEGTDGWLNRPLTEAEGRAGGMHWWGQATPSAGAVDNKPISYAYAAGAYALQNGTFANTNDGMKAIYNRFGQSDAQNKEAIRNEILSNFLGGTSQRQTRSYLLPLLGIMDHLGYGE